MATPAQRAMLRLLTAATMARMIEDQRRQYAANLITQEQFAEFCNAVDCERARRYPEY